MTDEPRRIAVARNYAEFTAALRARVVELGISYETVDAVGGLGPRHTNKLLSPQPLKFIGAKSWGSILWTLGLDVWLVENPERLAIAKRDKEWAERERPARVHTGGEHVPITVNLSRRFMRKISRKAAIARMVKLTPKQRSRIASHAAKARWAKPSALHGKPARPSVVPWPPMSKPSSTK